jgi:hypothetical protein
VSLRPWTERPNSSVRSGVRPLPVTVRTLAFGRTGSWPFLAGSASTTLSTAAAEAIALSSTSAPTCARFMPTYAGAGA